jgi:hypothetical protein
MILASVHIYWLILPLVVAISVVYSASRHESWRRIWTHSFRLGLWIMGLLVAATAVLLLINAQVCLSSGCSDLARLDLGLPRTQRCGVARGRRFGCVDPGRPETP